MTSHERTIPAPSLTPTRVLVLAGYFGCVAALIAALTGTWAIYRRHVVLAHWPIVAARVESCRLQRYDALLQSTSASFAVRCQLSYGIGVVRYNVPVRSRFAFGGADSLSGWVGAHPRGSSLLVHYDPREPAAVSLAGTGVVGEDGAVTSAFRGALAFGIAGAVLLLGAAGVDRRREHAVTADRRRETSHFPTPPVSMGALG